jgi:hypothetical protein
VYTNEHQDNWDLLLLICEFAYNNSKHAATGVTPFYANNGWHPNILVRNEELGEELTVLRAEAKAYLLWDLYIELTIRLKAISQNMGKYYDKKHLDREFEIGDQVWLRTEDYETTRLSKKLDHQQAGPFTIINQPTKQTYTLNIDKSAHIHNVLHMSKLEPCTPPVEGQADTQEELHLQLDIEWHMVGILNH